MLPSVKENKFYENFNKTAGNTNIKAILKYFSKDIREILEKANLEKIKSLEEIRLRAEKPLIIQDYANEWFIDHEGNITQNVRHSYIVKQQEILNTLELMSRNSIYAFQDEIRNGFITLEGGHRIGISGKAVIENGKIVNLKEFSSLNIRISRAVEGCSLKTLKYITNWKNNSVYNTLIVSPPQCGKTTLLRDLARVLSNGISEKGLKGMKIGLVDERSEIAACYKGVPQFDVGIRTDVLDGCPKSLGMIMMVRSMSPQVIITDEIGDKGDKDSIETILNAGVKLIASAHGYNISELKSRREVLALIEGHVFERYIVLSNAEGPGTIEEVVDGSNMEILYTRKANVKRGISYVT